MKSLEMTEIIEQRIFLIRGHRVMIDHDLAILYQVKTWAINQAVKRNTGRFPEDFVFRLTETEKTELLTICDRFRTLKHSLLPPYAFTEQGVAMLSSVLRSERAILVNVQIMRVFVQLRQLLSTHKDLAHQLQLLERKCDSQFKIVFDAIRELMKPAPKPRSPKLSPIPLVEGFKPK